MSMQITRTESTTRARSSQNTSGVYSSDSLSPSLDTDGTEILSSGLPKSDVENMKNLFDQQSQNLKDFAQNPSSQSFSTIMENGAKIHAQGQSLIDKAGLSEQNEQLKAIIANAGVDPQTTVNTLVSFTADSCPELQPCLSTAAMTSAPEEITTNETDQSISVDNTSNNNGSTASNDLTSAYSNKYVASNTTTYSSITNSSEMYQQLASWASSSGNIFLLSMLTMLNASNVTNDANALNLSQMTKNDDAVSYLTLVGRSQSELQDWYNSTEEDGTPHGTPTPEQIYANPDLFKNTISLLNGINPNLQAEYDSYINSGNSDDKTTFEQDFGSAFQSSCYQANAANNQCNPGSADVFLLDANGNLTIMSETDVIDGDENSTCIALNTTLKSSINGTLDSISSAVTAGSSLDTNSEAMSQTLLDTNKTDVQMAMQFISSMSQLFDFILQKG